MNEANHKSEMKKCKDLKYFLENYAVIKLPNGVTKKFNQWQIEQAVALKKAIDLAKSQGKELYLFRGRTKQ